MRLFVTVTDNDWFRFLRSRPELEEVNLWQPGGHRRFQALSPGEPLLFKLHSPEDFIVGGGFFTLSTLVPYSLAWEAFGLANGVFSVREMRRRIERFRGLSTESRDDYIVGCIVLRHPFFFDESDWLPIPEDFAKNLPGKGYEHGSETGRALWEELRLRLRGLHHGEVALQIEMFGEPRVAQPRLGAGAFRLLVTDTYQRRCAVTGELALPALDATHIRPVHEGGQHRVDNGLLLRADIRRLFDAGYVTVRPDQTFRVSRRLRDQYEGGAPYHSLDGQEIWRPSRSIDRPRREFLEWHGDVVFRG